MEVVVWTYFRVGIIPDHILNAIEELGFITVNHHSLEISVWSSDQ